MIKNPTPSSVATIRLTWQAILWRLLLTGLLLLVLAGSGLTVFSAITSRPDAHVLPPPTQPVEGFSVR